MSKENRNIEDYTKKYSRAPFESYQVIYRRRKVLERMSCYPHQKCLEIGCGSEPLFKFINDVEEWVVVEPSKEFYENAKACAPGNVTLINNYFDERILTQIFSGGGYNLIICSSLLHELTYPDIVLRNIWDLCTNETVVHVNVPNAKSLHRLLASRMGIIPNIYEKSTTQEIMQQADVVYDIDRLKEVCLENGFKIINEGSYFVKPFTHAQMQKCMDSKIFDENLLDGLYNLIEYMPEYGSEIFVELKRQ